MYDHSVQNHNPKAQGCIWPLALCIYNPWSNAEQKSFLQYYEVGSQEDAWWEHDSPSITSNIYGMPQRSSKLEAILLYNLMLVFE